MVSGKITALALVACTLIGAQAVTPGLTPAAAAEQTDLAAPAASLESGRYVGAQSITFTAQPGAEVRYTLDGTHPTRDSLLATGPISVEQTANVTAVAFTERAESTATVRGILIKTVEEPLSQFAVMSDIHLSTGEGPSMEKWGGYFDALKRIVPNPDALVSTESWNTAQANWLYEHLTALSADPATQGQPIFVFGHRPLPSTVWDGAQSSNSGLKSNLSDFPQVVYFSGHSHLNISDERSIHQEDFTSVNEGSMSYGEISSMYQVFGPGLAKNPTIPSAQSVVVDVYADRIEIDRINYAADTGRTYTDEGVWSFQERPPFASTGSLAGPTWTIYRGATPAEVKQQFSYTSANRNSVAPVWGEAEPSVRQTENGPVLRLPQAGDDQFTAEYSIEIRDAETGEVTSLVPAGNRIYADYVVTPTPAALDIPLAVRGGVDKPVEATLELGRSYEATLVAYDTYNNASEPRTFAFVAGEIDRSGVDVAAAAAEPVIAQIERVLGDASAAEVGDFDVAIADTDAATAAVANLRALFAEEPQTQDAVDDLGYAIVDATAAAASLMQQVDRAGLAGVIDEAEKALGGGAQQKNAAAVTATGDAAKLEQALRAELADAQTVQQTLNVPQTGIDTATQELRMALAAWQSAEQPGKPGTDAPGTGAVNGQGSPNTQGGALANTGATLVGAWIAGGALLAGAAVIGARKLLRRGRSEG